LTSDGVGTRAGRPPPARSTAEPISGPTMTPIPAQLPSWPNALPSARGSSCKSERLAAHCGLPDRWIIPMETAPSSTTLSTVGRVRIRGSFVSTLTMGASCRNRARPYLRHRVLPVRPLDKHANCRAGVSFKAVGFVRIAQLAKRRADKELGEADPSRYPRQQTDAARRAGQFGEELQACLQTHGDPSPGSDKYDRPA
jgi:hypothetical protein